VTVSWSAEIDEVLDGDHVLALVYVTPAKGTVLLPVSNFAVRDREAGTVSAVNTSVGVWRKLERIRANPRVALAYHTREHAAHDRPEFVLVQGEASLSPPIPDYPATISENWSRFEDWEESSRLWRRWRRIYGLRVEIRVAVERIVVWPELGCAGRPHLLGAPPPADPPPSQAPPKKGTGPRLDHRRAARIASGLPHALLGYVGADGYPLAVPVAIDGATDEGIVLTSAAGLIPPGARRAGLTAHWFSQGVVGQHQRKFTGWLTADAGGNRALYAPHTESSYRFPASKTLFNLVSGGATRLGLRGARRAGVVGPGDY
jgi:hypothetical protein